jgi:hypothetical protein
VFLGLGLGSVCISPVLEPFFLSPLLNPLLSPFFRLVYPLRNMYVLETRFPSCLGCFGNALEGAGFGGALFLLFLLFEFVFVVGFFF